MSVQNGGISYVFCIRLWRWSTLYLVPRSILFTNHTSKLTPTTSCRPLTTSLHQAMGNTQSKSRGRIEQAVFEAQANAQSSNGSNANTMGGATPEPEHLSAEVETPFMQGLPRYSQLQERSSPLLTTAIGSYIAACSPTSRSSLASLSCKHTNSSSANTLASSVKHAGGSRRLKKMSSSCIMAKRLRSET